MQTNQGGQGCYVCQNEILIVLKSLFNLTEGKARLSELSIRFNYINTPLQET